jgi:hypothetical protein
MAGRPSRLYETIRAGSACASLVHKQSYFGSLAERAIFTAPLLLAVAALLAWSVLQEMRLGLWDDVTHLINLSERVLDGQRPYVDFIMDNPPASLLIYVPPTQCARLLGLPVDLMTKIFVFAGAAASIAFCIRLAHKSDAVGDLGGQLGLLATVAALFVLPAGAFAQRDHIALIGALPMLVVMGIRASERTVGALSAMLAGLGGGLMVAIRPHYAMALGLAALYVAWRRGLRSSALFPEFYAAGLVCVAYLVATFLFFPSYVSDAMPMALALYAPLKLDPQVLLVKTPTGLIWITLAVLALVYRKQVAANAFALVAALASTGAFWTYIIQGKNFPYHGYVAIALAFVTVTLALPKSPRLSSGAPLAVTIGFCVAIIADSATGIWSVAMVSTILAFALIALAVTFLPESMAFRHVRWSVLSLGALFVAFGQAESWHQSGWRKDPRFLAEAEKIGHPKLALVSANGSFAEFLADRVGARWRQHVYSLGITEGVDFVLDRQTVDEATRQKLEAYRRREQDLLLGDIADQKPDAIIVEENWAKAHLAQPTLERILRRYRLVSTTGSEDSETDPILQFYVREGLENRF